MAPGKLSARETSRGSTVHKVPANDVRTSVFSSQPNITMVEFETWAVYHDAIASHLPSGCKEPPHGKGTTALALFRGCP
jgi:hypothetical protein